MEIKKKGTRVFYGKTAHIIAAFVGFAITAQSVYWIGRSDELQQIIDIVTDQGSVAMDVHDRRTKKKVGILMRKG